jgi:ATP-binding cassette subfamily B protein
VLLLDEPTSALDPWSETEWLAQLPEAVRGRTLVMVTHRFRAARAAGRIIVLERGSVVEQGTHEQLLALGGRYAEAWLFHQAEMVQDAAEIAE